jgi:thiamine-phosphate pyrophosphorylase
MVQYRRKDAPLETRSEEAKTILAWCREVACPLLINDDVALAQIVGADGVHLGRDDTDLGSARQQLGAAALIGVSCYDDLQRAQRLRQQGADYVAFGRFFPSQSKPHATPAPLALLQAARQTLDCPIVAIGGITRERVPALQQAGADLCAMIEGLFGP